MNKEEILKEFEKEFKTMFKDYSDKNPIDCEYCDGKRVRGTWSADEVWGFVKQFLSKAITKAEKRGREEVWKELLEWAHDIDKNKDDLIADPQAYRIVITLKDKIISKFKPKTK